MTLARLLSIRKSIYLEFFIIFSIALLARGNGIFSINWSCDDFLSIDESTGIGYAISQASQLRVFAALTTRIMGWLGAGFPPLGAFWNASHTASMVVFALALRKLWIPKSASIYGILIGLLFTLFPYHINLLAFQLQHPSMVMSYLTGAFAIANFNKEGWWKWVSVLAFAASLSYQTMISYFIAAGLILLLIQAANHWLQPQPKTIETNLRKTITYFIILVLGVITNFAISLLALRILHIAASDRATFAGLHQWPEKAQLIANHIKRTAYGKEPSMARSTKILQSLLWLVVALGLSRDFLLNAGNRKRLIAFLPLMLAVSAFTIAAAFLPTILMSHTSENPRNLLATVLFACGLVSLSSLMKNRGLKISAIGLACLLSLSYAVITNTLSVDMSRLTQRDLSNASRMVERLNQLSGNQKVRTVVFVGSMTPGEQLKGREYFQSGFQVEWAKLPLLQEASGQKFALPNESDRAKVASLARQLPPWPASGSVAVDGDVGVIVLSKAKS